MLSTERTKLISLKSLISVFKSRHAFLFSGVKNKESSTAITTRFPSSPKVFTNSWYWIFSGWSSGSKFASVKVNCMCFHCVAQNPVRIIKPARIRRRFLSINRATRSQTLAFFFFFIKINQLLKKANTFIQSKFLFLCYWKFHLF